MERENLAGDAKGKGASGSHREAESTDASLGLAHDWAAKVIAATGNYGEIFQRTMGGPYHLDRGLNALWTEGGLMRPLPMR